MLRLMMTLVDATSFDRVRISRFGIPITRDPSSTSLRVRMILKLLVITLLTRRSRCISAKLGTIICCREITNRIMDAKPRRTYVHVHVHLAIQLWRTKWASSARKISLTVCDWLIKPPIVAWCAINSSPITRWNCWAISTVRVANSVSMMLHSSTHPLIYYSFNFMYNNQPLIALDWIDSLAFNPYSTSADHHVSYQ